MILRDRQRRLLVLEALDSRARQFRSRDDAWPFRMPHEPLDLEALIRDALAAGGGSIDPASLRSRSVLRLDWSDGGVWDLWAVTLPSGLYVYCDSDTHESRVLASVKRGNAGEADGFFLERLAESRGHVFGIEMAGAPPDHVRSSIGDREFLADVFTELFEGTDAEADLKDADGRLRDASSGLTAEATGTDFHAVVVRWLGRVLSAPLMTRRQPRVRDEDPL